MPTAIDDTQQKTIDELLGSEQTISDLLGPEPTPTVADIKPYGPRGVTSEPVPTALGTIPTQPPSQAMAEIPSDVATGFSAGVNRAVGGLLTGAASLLTRDVHAPGYRNGKYMGDALAEQDRKRQALADRAAAEESGLGISGKYLTETGKQLERPGIPAAIGENVGAFLPTVLSGPAAPLEIGLQNYGETLGNQYEQFRKQGLSDQDALVKAIGQAQNAGLTQTAIWTVLPGPLQKIVGKATGLVGGGAVTQFLARRAGGAVTGATLGTASQVGGNIATGQPVGTGVGPAAAGMAILGALTPGEPPTRPPRAGIPETLKPTTTEAPSAILSESPPILRGVRPQPVEDAGKVSIQKSVEETGERGREGEAPTPGPPPVPVRSPLTERLENPDTFKGKNWTADALKYGAGLDPAKPETLAELKELEAKYAAELKSIPKTVENFDRIGQVGNRKQWVTEAIQAAEGLSERDVAREVLGKDYKPPFPKKEVTPVEAKKEEKGPVLKKVTLSGLDTEGNPYHLTNDGLYSKRGGKWFFKGKDDVELEVTKPDEIRKLEVGSPKPAKLTAAAVRTADGQVHTGPHHPGILERLGIKGFEDRESRNTDMFGFVDENGKFHTRPEAAKIAEATGQKLEEFDVDTSGKPQPHSDEIASPTAPDKSISETKPTKLKRHGTLTGWFARSDGVPDILDAIAELGGIASPSQAKFKGGGEYDAYNDAFSTGMARRLRRSEGGHQPDRLMKQLEGEPYNFKFKDADDFYTRVKRAAVERQNLEGQKTAEAAQLKKEEAQHEDFRKSVVRGIGTGNPAKTAGDVLAVGSKFEFQGQKFTVMEYNPDTDIYTLDDGRRFERQYLHADETFHPDPGTVEGEPTVEFVPPETPTPAPPTLRAGEKGTGELLQGADQPFNLAGETGVDAERIAAEKAKAEKAAAEAKAKQEREQQGFQGMGGAVPGEFSQSPQTPTGIKNATVDQERAKRGLPPAMQPARRSFGQVWDRAMAIRDQDPGIQDRLIAELSAKPRALTDVEDALLLHRQIDLQNEYGKATRDLAQAHEDGRAEAVEEEKLRVAGLSDQLLDLYNIEKTAGTETGRGLNARKMMAYENFTLAKMELDKRAANGGRPLTDAERAELTAAHDKLQALQKAYDEHVEKSAARAAELEIQKQIAEAKAAAAPSFHPKIVEAAEKIVKGFETRADAARARLKGKLLSLSPQDLADIAEIGAAHLARGSLEFGKWSAKMLADIGETIRPYLQQGFEAAQKRFDEMMADAPAAVKKAVRAKATTAERRDAAISNIADKVAKGKRNDIAGQVQKMARSFVEDGIADREKLIDAVHAELSKVVPEITRRETMDAISGYGDFKQLTKDQVSIQLRGMKGEMQQIAKLEDMAAKKPPLKTGIERRTPTEEERKLIKLVNDAKNKFQVPVSDPSRQLKSSLDTLKTTLTNRIADYEERLRTGDFAPRPRRQLTLDNEALSLKAKAEKLKQDIRKANALDRQKNRTTLEKTQDALVKWRRGFLLSGFRTLGKLFAAALQRMAITPVEQLAGVGISKAFPSFAEQVKYEASSIRAEAKALTEGITKGMEDAYQTLLTGQSELDILYGKQRLLPPEAIDFFGHLHGALKSITKRNEFARRFQLGVEWYMRHGIDVSDEFIHMRIGKEAYEYANRSIFMQDNRVVSAYKRALSALEQKNKATGKPTALGKAGATTMRVALPIVKVPTNIVAETMQYATGSVTGSVRLAQAYRRGIESLKPEEADLIMRQLKKGSLGGAAMLLGYFAAPVIGGYYQSGEKRKAGEPKAGHIQLFGHDIPTWLLHNPLLETLQIGATIRRVADSKLKKSDPNNQGITAGIIAGAVGLTEEVPFVRETLELMKAFNPHQRGEFAGELGRSLAVPQMVQELAGATDVDEKGNPIKRKPTTALERIKVGVPGLREQVKKAPYAEQVH